MYFFFNSIPALINFWLFIVTLLNRLLNNILLYLVLFFFIIYFNFLFFLFGFCFFSSFVFFFCLIRCVFLSPCISLKSPSMSLSLVLLFLFFQGVLFLIYFERFYFNNFSTNFYPLPTCIFFFTPIIYYNLSSFYLACKCLCILAMQFCYIQPKRWCLTESNLCLKWYQDWNHICWDCFLFTKWSQGPRDSQCTFTELGCFYGCTRCGEMQRLWK